MSTLPGNKTQWNGCSGNPRVCTWVCTASPQALEETRVFRCPHSHLACRCCSCWCGAAGCLHCCEVALASLDKIPHVAAAESCMARLGCDLGCPQCGERAALSASSQQRAGAPGRSLGDSCVLVDSPKPTLIHRQYCLLVNCFSLFRF